MEHAILLVDDDASVLSCLVRALQRQPYQIYTAHNGEEAVWVLKTRTIDLIVTDERMPGMSGSELLTWVNEHCPNVIRVVLTGYAETNTAIRAINECGVCHFFTKPCNEVHLAMFIRKMLDQKEAVEKDREVVETSRQQIRELERLNLDVEFQARILCQDMQRPLRRILDCCQQCEDLRQEDPDGPIHTCMKDARAAVADIQQLSSHLQSLVDRKPPTAPTVMVLSAAESDASSATPSPPTSAGAR